MPELNQETIGLGVALILAIWRFAAKFTDTPTDDKLAKRAGKAVKRFIG